MVTLQKKLKVVTQLKFIDGDNISITQNGKDFTIATKKDVTFDTVLLMTQLQLQK